MKKQANILFLCILIAGTGYSMTMDEPISGIIYWDYNSELSIPILEENSLNALIGKYEICISVPLEEINQYYWDEQIFSISADAYEEKYAEKLYSLFKKSDRGSLFFSVVIQNRIVLNGLNRMVPSTAEMQKYDDTSYPRISVLFVRAKVDLTYFRLSISSSFSRSIWDIPKAKERIGSLFSNRIYKYYKAKKKIVRGYVDIEYLSRYGIVSPRKTAPISQAD